jgi:hypothetical protein
VLKRTLWGKEPHPSIRQLFEFLLPAHGLGGAPASVTTLLICVAVSFLVLVVVAFVFVVMADQDDEDDNKK